MPVDDVRKKARYARKPPEPPTIARPKPSAPAANAPPASTGASAAARRALGFAEAGVEAPKTGGARAAHHGLGFLERARRGLRRGAVAALLGLELVSGPVAVAARPAMAPPNQVEQKIAAAKHRQLHALTSTTAGARAAPDVQILLDKWETYAAQDPSFQIDQSRARDLIAKGLLPAQIAPNADFATFGREHLGDDSKQMIRAILGKGRLPITDDARKLLEEASGFAGVTSPDGKVTVLGDQSGGAPGQGHITLRGPAGAQVEALNLSTIPTKRLFTDETILLGTVGADGAFAGDMQMRPGDVIRLRLKLPDGSTTQFVDFKARGIGDDTRNAELALFRIGLVDEGGGTIQVNNINEGRPVSEPGATARFVNNRTGVATDVVFDKDGTFPKGTTLPGQAGDTYSVRITDGVNDKELAQEVGTVTVRSGQPAVNVTFDLQDPTLHHDEMENGKPKFSMERYHGPLFGPGGARYTDVVQGQLGDCYFPSSIADIAFHKPGTFEKIIQEKHETDPQTGEEKVWYEVHFKDWDKKDVVVKVDGDLYSRSWGGPLYGSTDGDHSPENLKMWFPIVEKAYAMWKGGSYEDIGNGGMMSDVFSAILGVDATSMGIDDQDAVWKQIVENVDKHRPIGAGTHGEDQDALYANTGIYSDHAYSILGYKTENGVKYVQLRNPWGESEPQPGDGKNDGIFYLKLDSFMKLYQTLFYVTEDG